MKFAELPELDRIQYVKDGFILILERLARNPGELSKYYTKIEQPKVIVASLERIVDSMSDEEKTAIQIRNDEVLVKTAETNEKARTEYNEMLALFKRAETIIKGLQKKEGCLCGSCVNIEITNGIVPAELEFLIDFARKEAEARNY